MRLALLVAPLLFLLAGCEQDISSLTIHGTLDGEEWLFTEGEARADASVGGYRAELHADYYAACFVNAPPGNRVLLGLPQEVGFYDLAEGQFTVTFVVEQDSGDLNYEAVEGSLEIGTIDETNLSGGLVARLNQDFEVNGQFEIGICMP